MKKLISELEEGQQVDSLFSVKYKKPIVPYEGGFRFVLGASDRSGEIEIHYWGGAKEDEVREVYERVKEGEVVRVRGFVGKFREKLKIDVNQGSGTIERSSSYSIEDFIAKSPRDASEMRKELKAIIESIDDSDYRKLVKEVLKRNEERFYVWPAAMYLHHAHLNGLLEHTLNCCKMGDAFARIYSIDRDLLIAGLALHDIGKTKEFEVSTNIKVGEEGMLRGHIVIGEEIVREVGKEIGTDERKLNKVCHIIISHHGTKEYGSPKEPEFPEAVATHYIDLLDSRTVQYMQAIEEANTEDFRTYKKGLGEIYLR
ncbi:MAG: HD domain-containing protein [Candidatus Anstonellales archaeon]